MIRTLLVTIGSCLWPAFVLAQSDPMSPWKANEEFSCVIKDDYLANTKVGAETFGLSQKLTLDSSWRVQSVTESGGATFTVKITRLRYLADGKGAAAVIQELAFDSEIKTVPKQQPQKGVSELLRTYVGPVGTVTVDERGRVTDFTLSEPVEKKLNDGLTRELAGFFGDFFTANGLQHRLTNWLIATPPDQIATGATWEQVLPSRFGKRITCTRTFAVAEASEEVEAGTSKVTVKTDFQVAPGNAKLEVLQHQGAGVVYLDNQTHRVSHMELRQQGTIKSFGEQEFEISYSARIR